MLKNSTYVTIQSWMRTELNLKGNDLLVYAIIYGFSQTDNQKYTGSIQYLADWCGATRQGIQKNLKNLIDRNLVTKEVSKDGNSVTYCATELPTVQLSYQGVQLSLHNNIVNTIEDNIENNKSINTIENSDFLGSIKKPKKQNLYSKAIALIMNFTDDKSLQQSLINFLDLQLEIYKSSGKIFYINTFKNRLNKLKNEFTESEWQEVVDYATSRGWQNFFPVPKTRNINQDGSNKSFYDENYQEEQEHWQLEMKKNGKQTKF